MNSDIPESDPDDPQEAPAGESGAPEARYPTALDKLFASESASNADANIRSGSADRLAALFAGEEQPRRNLDDRLSVGKLDDVWWGEPDAPTAPLREAAAAAGVMDASDAAGAVQADVSEPAAATAMSAGPPVPGGASASAAAATAVMPPRQQPPSRAPEGGTFAARHTRLHGVRGALFGSAPRVFFSVAAAVLLVAAIVIGAVFGAQTLAANARLADARKALSAAQASVAQPATDLASATTAYDATAKAARATSDASKTVLAALAGTTDGKPLAAAVAANAALAQALAVPAPVAPEPYTPAHIDTSDVTAVIAETHRAREAVGTLTSTTTTLKTATSDIGRLLAALTSAKKVLGSSLPKTASILIVEDDQAAQSFRDDVTAKAAAVVRAQAAGKSGDAELIAWAAAVKALRADQARAVSNSGSTTPNSGGSNQGTNQGTTSPTPSPAPKPTPKPSPTPTPTPTP